MFSSIRTRLSVICVVIVVLSMLVLTGVKFFKVSSDIYQALDEEMALLAESRADNIAEWVHTKRTIASSIKLAMDQPDPLPFVKAAMVVGSFDDALPMCGSIPWSTMSARSSTRLPAISS